MHIFQQIHVREGLRGDLSGLSSNFCVVPQGDEELLASSRHCCEVFVNSSSVWGRLLQRGSGWRNIGGDSQRFWLLGGFAGAGGDC